MALHSVSQEVQCEKSDGPHPAKPSLLVRHWLNGLDFPMDVSSISVAAGLTMLHEPRMPCLDAPAS